MLHRVLLAPIWGQLQAVMKEDGCRETKNGRKIQHAKGARSGESPRLSHGCPKEEGNSNLSCRNHFSPLFVLLDGF